MPDCARVPPSKPKTSFFGPDYFLKDGDTKFTAKFDEVFRSEGIKMKRFPPASPNLNAHTEHFVQAIKHECLNHFVVIGEHHLEHLVREYEAYYNIVRPHQGLGNRTIPAPPPPTEVPLDPSEIECDSRLGGLLRHYYRRAA